jgi:transmembrane sensor
MLVLAAGGIFYWFYDPATEISTRLAEHQITYLPDSTQITLNAATTVRYQARRWKQNREVALEGEAFFDVRKGSSFTVKTRLGDVTVLGTRFNVRLRAGRFEVTCYEGKVSVRAGQEEQVLEPGMKFLIKNNQAFIESGEVGQGPSWLNQESAFESAPLGEVLEELERQYGISVSTRNVDTTKLFSGRFSHEDLNVALESIAFPMHLTFKISPNRKNVEFSGEIP